MQRLIEDLVTACLLDHLAGVHNHDIIRYFSDDTEIMGDHHNRGTGLLLQLVDQIEDLRLDRHIEGRGRLVTDQELRITAQCHRDHHTLTHTAGKLMRILIEATLCERDLHELQHLDRALLRFLLRHILVQKQCLDELLSDGEHRIQRGHRLLENHRDLLAADLTHLILGHLYDIFSIEEDLATLDLTRLLDQSHDGKRGHTLSTAGLTYDTQCLSLLHIEGNIIDRLYKAGLGMKVGFQILYL